MSVTEAETKGALFMGTEWIDAVLQMNAQIAAAETRFNIQVARVIEAAERGQNSTEEEVLLSFYRTSLDYLRIIQRQCLRDTTIST